MHTDASLQERLTQAVAELERRTAAEIVVVVSPRSGSYLDLSLGLGLVLSALGLAVVLYSPWTFSPLWVLPDLLLLGAAVTWLVNRQSGLLRALVPRARQSAQVDLAAAAAFTREGVHRTRGRQGVLVYASALEAQVRVIPDVLVERLVGQEAMDQLPWDLHHEAGLFRGLGALGDLLAARLPPDPDRQNELEDRPRMAP